MKVSVKITDPSIYDYPTTSTVIFENVWELQDNEGTFLVIKFYNHECELIEKSKTLQIEVKV